MSDAWRSIVATALDAREAHVSFDRAVADLPAEARGTRPAGFVHSAWELVDHVRLAQDDLIAYLEDPAYQAPSWPDDYWPPTAAPPSDEAWHEAVAATRAGRERLKELVLALPDPAATIPWGGSHTYLRTILLALDHEAYHVGQLVQLRRAMGAWASPGV